MEIEIDKINGEIVFKHEGKIVGNLKDAMKEESTERTGSVKK